MPAVQRLAAGDEGERIEVALRRHGVGQRRQHDAPDRASNRARARRRRRAATSRCRLRAAAADEDDDPRLRPRRLQARRRCGGSGRATAGRTSAGGSAAPKLSKICTASAPASIWRDQIGGRGRDQPVDQGRHESRVAIGEQRGPAPDRACPCRRSCSSPPSRARRRSRGASSRGGSAALQPVERLEHRRETLERQLLGKPAESRAGGDRIERGPSSSTKRTSWPSACGTTRMSENRIAASKPKRRIGCSVTSAASRGL